MVGGQSQHAEDSLTESMRQFRDFERASGGLQPQALRAATPNRRKRRELAVFGMGIAMAAPSPPPPPPLFADTPERRHDAAVAVAVRAAEEASRRAAARELDAHGVDTDALFSEIEREIFTGDLIASVAM